MGFDTRTLMVVFSMMTFMFFGLFELAGLHVGRIRGVRQWAIANLCISIGLSSSYFYTFPAPGHAWAVVLGASLSAAGLTLFYTGLQAFMGKPLAWKWPVMLVGTVFFINVWFCVIYPDIRIRAIINSLTYALIAAISARALLIKVESPLRTAYWFTGLSFVALLLLMLVRASTIWQTAPGSYGLYVNIPINPVSFFIASLLLLCIAFGFLLMINFRLLADLQKIASRDALTGAFNRRRLEEEAIRLKARCLRTGDNLAIMMIDLDFFKKINDRHGHLVGDKVLRRFADIAQSAIRGDDYFARYGGEEFCILLPSTSEAEAWELAERLRKSFASQALVIDDLSINIQVSIGVADSVLNGLEFDNLLNAADLALYRAKKDGRNLVVAYSSMARTEQASG